MAANSIRPPDMWNHRGDRTEAHDAWNSGKLAGTAHREQSRRTIAKGSRFLLVSTAAAGCSLPGGTNLPHFQMAGLFGKKAGPAEGKWNRRAETECGEEEKCKTII